MSNNDHKAPDDARIEIIAGTDCTQVNLYGPIDMESSPVVRDRLLTLLQAPDSKKVSIDLSAVTHFDSSGVASLIEALKIARSHNTELSLQGLQGRLFRFFEITGIANLFNRSIPR